MNKTGIEYLDYTWNPIAMRCSPVSEGCANCWHLAVADPMKNNPKLSDKKRACYAGDSGPLLLPDELTAPSRRKKPSIIGVQFMGDLFHERVEPFHFALILDQIKKCPQHTFLMLTKRPDRMIDDHLKNSMILQFFDPPMPNLWLGVTAENQYRWEERIYYLMEIPAHVRLVSVEPMLGPIEHADRLPVGEHYLNPLTGHWSDDPDDHCSGPKIDWVICGGESGKGARPMHPDWARSLRDQCVNAGTPFFFKQWGEWIPRGPISCGYPIIDGVSRIRLSINGKNDQTDAESEGDAVWMQRVGKKKAGRLLDGKEWNQFPVIK